MSPKWDVDGEIIGQLYERYKGHRKAANTFINEAVRKSLMETETQSAETKSVVKIEPGIECGRIKQKFRLDE